MGNDLFSQKDGKIINPDTNEKDDLFNDESKENKLILNYIIESPGETIRLVGSKFYEKNKDSCKICIDFVVKDLLEFYKPKKNEKFITVVLALSHKIIDLSYMFSECSSLKSILNLDYLNISNITDLSYMFFGCSSLDSLSDISTWKTNKVKDMSHMFHGCSSLKSLSLISKWETYNVTDMSYMFYGCSSLTSLDDISQWNINKVNDISLLFYMCPLLNNTEIILNEFFKNKSFLKIKEEEERKRKEEEKKRKEEELERKRIEKELERKRKEDLEIRRRLEKNSIEEEKLKVMKKKMLENQKKLRMQKSNENININKKEINEKINEVLEDMCIYGNVMNKEIKKDKKEHPEKYIETYQALQIEKEDPGLFALGLLSNNLENIGIETIIEKDENEEDQDVASTGFQFITNGMYDKKNMIYILNLGKKEMKNY